MRTIEALQVALRALDPHEDVGGEGRLDAHYALTTDCEDPSISRLDHAPAHTNLILKDGYLEEYGSSEILDAPWDESESYWCTSCDTEMNGYQVALAHAHGIDLTEHR